ncbi:MAG TPA: hypothetical protein DCK98_16280 [Chloroflexi bacterium]|nr:hypothetical protein [Chloroflexota bacterium]HAL27411.1 hypothetical protein [Chloroflexota bacterium]
MHAIALPAFKMSAMLGPDAPAGAAVDDATDAAGAVVVLGACAGGAAAPPHTTSGVVAPRSHQQTDKSFSS